MPKFIVTYTTDRAATLSDEYVFDSILAHTQREAELIVHNVERVFHGVTVECEELARKRPRRSKINSDRRSSKHRRL